MDAYKDLIVIEHCSSEELAKELKHRHHYYREMTDDEIKEEAESRGFFISYHDERKEILEDIYRHATWMSSERLKDYLRDLFIKYLHKWI